MNPPRATPLESLPTVKLDASSHITEDLLCRQCGYNLRTLSTKVCCPECGTAVARSVYGDYLRYADPAWVRGLAIGTTMVLVAIILQVLVTGVTFGLLFTYARYAKWYAKWTGVLYIGITFMGGIGFWLMTYADRGSTEILARNNPRKIARILLVVWLCLAVSGPLRRGSIAIVQYSVDILNLAISIGFVVAMLSCINALLLRIPDELLAKSCRRFAVFLIVTMILSELVDSIGIFGAGSTFLAANRMIILYSAAILTIFRAVWAIRISFRLRVAFRDAAQRAQTTSDAHNSPSPGTEGGVQ